MRDPYEVLGVDRKASATDIKSAYRRLAKKLHPDANKNDPKAATRFAELNAAHEILEDEDKRKAFDRGEIDAEGKPRFQGFGGGGANPGAGFGGDGNFEKFQFWSRRLHPHRPARARRQSRWWRRVRRRLRGYFAGRFWRRRPRCPRQFRTGGFRCRRRRSSRNVGFADGRGQRFHPAAAFAERQGRRRQDSGRHHERPAHPAQRPGHGRAGRSGRSAHHRVRSRRIRSSRSTAPTCGSICRSRSTRRRWAPRCGCRRSTSRSRSRCRRGPRADAPSASRAKAFRPKPAAAICLPPSASSLPETRDAELDELMKTWQRDKPYDPRKDM